MYNRNFLNKSSEQLAHGIAFADMVRDTKRPNLVVFGSARLTDKHLQYKYLIDSLMRLTDANIVTGGGSGLMEVSNREAFNHNPDRSFGVAITNLNEGINEYCSACFITDYFFVRKVVLAEIADCYLALEGGIGTCDEVFEILTLMQTKKIPAKPVIIYDPLRAWQDMFESMAIMETLTRNELPYMKFTQTIEQTIKILTRELD